MNWPGAAEWLALFTGYLIKTTLVLAVCLLLVSASRGRTAAIRHFLLSCFLIGLLLLPVASTFRFGWETDLLPGRTPVTANQAERETAGSSESGFPVTLRLFSKPAVARANSASGADNAAVPAMSQEPGFIGILGSLLPLIWSAGLAFLLLKISLGILGARRLTREGSDVTDRVWRILLDRFLAAIRIGRKVRLKSHGAISVPIIWGWIRPVILLPCRHEEWTEDQRSSALLHELCHIKRADLLVMFLVRLSLTVFWFNPLCWIVFRRLKQEQECACDELVLTAGIRPSAYADTLLFFKRTAGFRQNFSAAFLGLLGSDAFHERLAAILRQKLTLKEVAMKTRITLAIAVMLAVSLIGMARPSKAVSEQPLRVNAHAAMTPQPAGLPARVLSYSPGRIVQDTKVDVQKEQGEKKDVQKQTIIITNTKGEKVPIEITIVTGDTARSIQVAKPLTIKKGKEGGLILLGPDGKEVEILKGEPLRLTIEGKDLTLVKEGSLLKIDKAGVLSLISEKDKEGRVIVQATPRVKIEQSGEGGAKKLEIYIPQKSEDERRIVGTVGQDQTAVLKEKLKALQEKLAQSKKKQVDVEEVRQAIEKLISELVEQKVRKRVEVKVGDKPMTFTIVRPEGVTLAGSGIWIMKDAGKSLTAVMKRDGANFSIMFGINPGENGRAVYDRVVAKVKQELPEGFALVPEFNEKSGSVTLKITGSGTQKASAEFIKKIVEVIKAEIK